MAHCFRAHGRRPNRCEEVETRSAIEKEVTSWQSLHCILMHFHDNLTDTQHYITLDHDVNFGSTTPQILRGVRLAIRPNYFPPEVTSPTWTTRTTLQTSDTVHSSPTTSEREDVATIFQANPLYLSSNVGREPERHREVGEYYRVKVLKLFITKTGSVKRQLQVIHGNRKDVFKPSCHADDFPNERPFSENCMQRRSRVRRKSTNLSSRVSIESEQSLEAQREILTHEAAEEIHRRDNKSLRVWKTLKFELRCRNLESSVRREGFGQTREHLQRNINSSNEKYRKYVNLYEAFQNERASFSGARCSTSTVNIDS